MGVSNLLNTRTANMLELVGNGKIYRVPPYQREYSWEEDQWEDLWNDVQELRSGPEERHYMGAVVVQARSDREFLIIDGQQRLATLSILALALISRLGDLAREGRDPEANRERAAALRNRFIGEKDPASLVESSKLRLNETDDPFYQDYLVQLRAPLNPRGLSHSNRLLWNCFRYFKARFEQADMSGSGEALASVLAEAVGRQLLFILITVEDELNAYTVFETLNARGVELTTTDLLKNYLFSKVRVGADLDSLQRRWQSLVATVRAERFPEFLRYHLLCAHPSVRSQRLFKMVRQQAGTDVEVFALLDALEGRAELFAALSDPHHGFWVELPEARPHIQELNLFRVKQMTPLLFAAWERLDSGNFVRILKLVRTLAFRYSVIGKLNTNALEPVYHEAARAVLEGRARIPADVFGILERIYVDDRRFQQDLAELDLGRRTQGKKIARYILARLEQDATGKACDHETDPGTLEHILPENPSADWSEAFPEKLWSESVWRLGNLTLLEPALNRQIGNATYAQKTEVYSRSAYGLTQEIPDQVPEAWTPAHLEARQARMAARAVHLWRADF